MCGYAHQIGASSVTKVELWGLLDGLIIARDRGYWQVEVEVDNLFVVNEVLQDRDVANDYSSLVRSIKELLHRDWTVRLKHVFREANRCADIMLILQQIYH